MVPALVIHCINEIEQRGMSEIGLYRVPGSDKEVKALKVSFSFLLSQSINHSNNSMLVIKIGECSISNARQFSKKKFFLKIFCSVFCKNDTFCHWIVVSRIWIHRDYWDSSGNEKYSGNSTNLLNNNWCYKLQISLFSVLRCNYS